MMRRVSVLSFALLTFMLAAVPTVSAQPAACNGQPVLPLYDFARECGEYAGDVVGNLGDTVSCLQKEVFVIVFCDVIGGPFCQLVPPPCQ